MKPAELGCLPSPLALDYTFFKGPCQAKAFSDSMILWSALRKLCDAYCKVLSGDSWESLKKDIPAGS